MAEFSATDAALNGFRLVWERPISVVYWSVLQFAFSLGLTAFMSVSAGPALTKLAGMNLQPGATDPSAVLELFWQILPTYIVLLAAVLVLYAVLYAAMNRAVLQPSDSAFGYLRLSSDELRQLSLFAIYFVMGLLLYVALVIVGAVLAAIIGIATGGGAAAVPMIALAIMLPLIACVFIFLGVRLSLASPMTFASHKIDLFGSWSLTRGRFWALLGAYFIAFALNIVVLLLTLAIAAAALMVVGGGVGALADLSQSDMSSLDKVLKPGRVAYFAVSSVGTALAWPIMMTPPAVIYRALTQTPGGTSRVFE